MDKELSSSLRDYTRAAGGGLVIGMPLLYTMEVWFQGFLLPWWKLLLLLGVGFVIVLGYNSVAGFRRERTHLELVVDSISTIGLGIVVAFVALLFLGRIDAETSIRDAAGKVALEAIPVAFGASVAVTQLSGEQASTGERRAATAFGRLFVGAGGALLFALNVAPTEEIVILGTSAEPWLLLLVIAATLALTMALVFYADFGGRRRTHRDELLDRPLSETVSSYAVSIGVALLLLWSFGRTEGASVSAIAGMTVMLGAVGSVGAAIARLLIGGEHEAAGEGGA
ncbi:MAG: TIGR02587 family membrane protein [Chloroflexota bacterium]|nr:TIGR02587 family membrane protein [Chloroflexota bacterium]